MVLREIYARSILVKSQVFDYVVNPYIGCQHSCVYCYARFMKRFTGHKEPWGEFVDVKINALALLKREIDKRPPGRVWVSGVCDPYQPLESKYELTRKCLEILVAYGWPITVQTKSPLVLRDIDLLRRSDKTEVGLSVTSADDGIRKLFEPGAPSIKERIEVLEELHLVGIRTFAMIAPMLPGADELADQLSGKVDYVLIDRMNYHYGDWVYKKYGLEHAISYDFFLSKGKELASAFTKQGIECRLLF
ncbi:MAG: radical SAM protein [Dehalococcoidia bacterium]|nr:radical SAM protein [Dehalococcoidia bacterium]MDH4291635.1 radical SAM protein [Dehalococcoidia bacterium]